MFERVRKRIRELFEEIESEIEKSMWSPDGVLEPLYTFNMYPDRYEVLVDLPYSDLDSLSIEVKGDRLILRCRLKRELEFSSWFSSRGVKFREYQTEIKLPPDIDPSNVRIEKITTKNIVKVIFRRRM